MSHSYFPLTSHARLQNTSGGNPRTTCYAYDPRYGTSYGYHPSLAAGIIFCVLFGISCLSHIVQAAFLKAGEKRNVSPAGVNVLNLVAEEDMVDRGMAEMRAEMEGGKNGFFGLGKKTGKVVKVRRDSSTGRQWFMIVFALGALGELLGMLMEIFLLMEEIAC